VQICSVCDVLGAAYRRESLLGKRGYWLLHPSPDAHRLDVTDLSGADSYGRRE
jgi:hypothetical protein